NASDSPCPALRAARTSLPWALRWVGSASTASRSASTRASVRVSGEEIGRVFSCRTGRQPPQPGPGRLDGGGAQPPPPLPAPPHGSSGFGRLELGLELDGARFLAGDFLLSSLLGSRTSPPDLPAPVLTLELEPSSSPSD